MLDRASFNINNVFICQKKRKKNNVFIGFVKDHKSIYSAIENKLELVLGGVRQPVL
jgi:hypothetical protein